MTLSAGPEFHKGQLPASTTKIMVLICARVGWDGDATLTTPKAACRFKLLSRASYPQQRPAHSWTACLHLWVKPPLPATPFLYYLRVPWTFASL